MKEKPSKLIQLLNDNEEAQSQYNKIRKQEEKFIVVFRIIYAQICGSLKAGLLLSRLRHLWYNVFGCREFFYTDSELQSDLFLSVDEIKNARKILVENGFIQVTRRGVPAKCNYTYFDDQVLEAMLCFDSEEQNSLTESQLVKKSLTVQCKSHELVSEKSTNSINEGKERGLRTKEGRSAARQNGQLKAPESTLGKKDKKKQPTGVQHHGHAYVQFEDTNGKPDDVNKWNSNHFIDYFGSKYFQRYKKKEWTLVQQKGVSKSKMKRIIDEFTGELNKRDLLELIDYFFAISVKATRRTWDLNYFISQHSTMLNEMINLRSDVTSEDGLPSRIPSTKKEEKEIQDAIHKKLKRTK